MGLHSYLSSMPGAVVFANPRRPGVHYEQEKSNIESLQTSQASYEKVRQQFESLADKLQAMADAERDNEVHIMTEALAPLGLDLSRQMSVEDFVLNFNQIFHSVEELKNLCERIESAYKQRNRENIYPNEKNNYRAGEKVKFDINAAPGLMAFARNILEEKFADYYEEAIKETKATTDLIDLLRENKLTDSMLENYSNKIAATVWYKCLKELNSNLDEYVKKYAPSAVGTGLFGKSGDYDYLIQKIEFDLNNNNNFNLVARQLTSTVKKDLYDDIKASLKTLANKKRKNAYSRRATGMTKTKVNSYLKGYGYAQMAGSLNEIIEAYAASRLRSLSGSGKNVSIAVDMKDIDNTIARTDIIGTIVLGTSTPDVELVMEDLMSAYTPMSNMDLIDQGNRISAKLKEINATYDNLSKITITMESDKFIRMGNTASIGGSQDMDYAAHILGLAGVNNPLEVIIGLLNSQEEMILGENSIFTESFKQGISAGIAYLLFDDWVTIGTPGSFGKVNVIHIFNFEGMRLPLSVLLDRMASSFRSVMAGLDFSSDIRVTVTLPHIVAGNTSSIARDINRELNNIGRSDYWRNALAANYNAAKFDVNFNMNLNALVANIAAHM